jgi:hypothetical protein
MIKRILLLFLLMELGVIGWFFQQANPEEDDLGHGQPSEFNEGELMGTVEEDKQEPVVEKENGSELLGLLPDLFTEILQFGQLQNDVISSDLLQEIDKLQLEAASSLALNEDGFKEILEQLLDDPENRETIEVYYKWLREQLEDNEERLREVMNNQDSFHEEKVAEAY